MEDTWEIDKLGIIVNLFNLCVGQKGTLEKMRTSKLIDSKLINLNLISINSLISEQNQSLDNFED